MTKRVLLTGASGFVGSHVLRHLLVNTDWEIVCPVTFTHKGVQDRIRLSVEKNPEHLKRVKLVYVDLSAPLSSVTAHAFGRIDYVLNLASESHVDRSIEEPAPFVINNVQLICHLLDWARSSDHLEKFVHISTDEVYGPAPIGHDHAEWEDLHFPSNPYSASKAAQEDIAYAYWRTYGVPLIITNTMNIIGETQDTEKFVPLVMKSVLSGYGVRLHGDSEGNLGSRFYLHARNQADALLHIINTQEVNHYSADNPVKTPERFHVVGEKELDNLEMAKLIADFMDMPLKYEVIDYRDKRPGHDLRYALDGSKLAATGWTAPVSLEDSLEKVVKWTLENREWLSL
jgi:dTDP-glucose 4,6-dehydratase